MEHIKVIRYFKPLDFKLIPFESQFKERIERKIEQNVICKHEHMAVYDSISNS